MADEQTYPAPAAILGRLLESGTGTKKLELIQGWIDENPGADGKALLLWCEDQNLRDREMLPEGTLQKIGEMVEGDEYGPRRRAGETNNDQVKHLNAEITQLKHKLKIANSAHGHNANLSVVDRTRIVALEDENMALRHQIQMMGGPNQALPPRQSLQTPLPSKKERGVRHMKHKPVAGTDETVGQLASQAE